MRYTPSTLAIAVSPPSTSASRASSLEKHATRTRSGSCGRAASAVAGFYSAPWQQWWHCVSDPSLGAMMERESRLLARFDHPAIPRLLEFTATDGALWMITQYLDGEARDVAKPAGVKRGAEVVLGVLDVFGYLDGVSDLDGSPREVVHRDAAPGDVLLRRDGTVALVDFSIATGRWRRDPDRGVMKCTRGYMAPEVVTGEREADVRVDLFATGVLLWELTAGERLYAGDPLTVMTAVVESSPPRPSEQRPGYPMALEAVVLRARARSTRATSTRVRWPR